MHKIYLVFKIIILAIIPILLNSCASSSYYERYGTSSKKKISISKIEDEIVNSPSNVKKEVATDVIARINEQLNSNVKKKKFLTEIEKYLNTPYKYGGESLTGIDCSAFTQKVYNNSLNVKIPRTAREQYKSWEIINNKEDLKFGDLIYFNTSKIYFPGHVGIYLDDNLFAHASTSKGVIISSLINKYYSDRYIGANRIKLIKQNK